MATTIAFQNTDNYLAVKITGQWVTDSILKSIEAIRAEADTLNVKHILLDLQDLSFPDNEMTRFFSGMKIASEFNQSYKIAGYSQIEKINRFAENVAVNRGAMFKMFTSETDALNWLLD